MIPYERSQTRRIEIREFANKSAFPFTPFRNRLFYLTDHYVNYPVVLVRLPRIQRDALRELLEASWQFVSTKTRPPLPTSLYAWRGKKVHPAGFSPCH